MRITFTRLSRDGAIVQEKLVEPDPASFSNMWAAIDRVLAEHEWVKKIRVDSDHGSIDWEDPRFANPEFVSSIAELET